MRDVETDSWWSIMRGLAIGGSREGDRLVELPVGEKTTFGDWRAKHPATLVLSVEGREHRDTNPYENYHHDDDRTYRGIEIDDDRLGPKENVFTFRLGDQPYAAPHSAIEGGASFDVEEDEDRLFLYREKGVSMYASTRAWLVPAGVEIDVATLDDHEGVREITGFDTFWYTWVGMNPETKILR